MLPWINFLLLLYSVHLHGIVDHSHVPHFMIGIEHLKESKMSNIVSDILGRHIDPGEALNSTDLVRLLMNDSTTKVRELEEHIKENLDIEREHRKKMVETVVAGLCKRINNIEEFTISCKNDLSKTLTDLDLKLTTMCTYQEHLIYNLTNNIHDLTDRLQLHEKSCKATMDIIRCEMCSLTFTSIPDYNDHKSQHHRENYDFSCSLCGKVFKTESCLSTHMSDCTPVIQFLQPSNIPFSQTFPQYAPENVLQDMSESCACYVCGEIFPSGYDLESHVVQAHGHSYGYPSNQVGSQNLCPSFLCNYCGFMFETKSHLELHITEVHCPTVSSPDFTEVEFYPGHHNGSVSCTICGYTCYSSEMLSLHLPCHDRSNVVHCNKCERSFNNIVLLNTHNVEHHTKSDSDPGLSPSQNYVPSHSESISAQEACIPQYDGVDDISEVSDNEPDNSEALITILPAVNSIAKPVGSHESNHAEATKNHATTHAPYTLNKRKQITTLAKHSNLIDFNIDITSAHNTNIQCSAGFYEAVPKPALSAIYEGFRVTVSGTLVSCIESRVKKDQLGRHDNLVLRFLVATDGGTTAVVHLHHTQQLVQVQGSASQWFVKNFLKHIFATEAESKRLVINNLNKVFEAAGRGLDKQIDIDSESCTHCGIKFRKNSKPAICGNCTGSFHNTKQNKCFLSHNCRTSGANPTLSATHSSSPTPTLHGTNTVGAAPISTSRISSMAVTFVPSSRATATTTTSCMSIPCFTPSRLTSVPSLSTSITSIESFSTEGDQASGAVVQPPQGVQLAQNEQATHHVHELPHTQDLGDHNEFEVIASTSRDLQQLNTEPSHSLNTNTLKFPSTASRQRNTNINLANPENEFLRTTLNSCRSNIIQQEAEIKRLKETLSIRNRRIMQLEDEIKHAGDYVASRESSTSADDHNHKYLGGLIEKLSHKLSAQSCGSSTTNVYVNSMKVANESTQSKHTQTCNDWNTLQGSNYAPEIHIESVHVPASKEPMRDQCGGNSRDKYENQNHKAGDHSVHLNSDPPDRCNVCGKTFLSENDLKLHVETDHGTMELSEVDTTPSSSAPVTTL